MLKRKDLIMKRPGELAEILTDYAKDKKGEIADLTYAAALQIKALEKIKNEKSDALYALESKIDDVVEDMCDHFCRYPAEAEDDDALISYCENCPLNKLREE